MEIFSSIYGTSKRFCVIQSLLVIGILMGGTQNGLSQTDDIALTVTFVGGGNAIDFGRMKNLESDGTPATQTATRQVRLLIQPVQSNNKQYIVTQVLNTELTQEGGAVVSPNSILFRVEEETGTGTIRVPDQTPIELGEQEIYRSAPTGGESQLLITYDLIASPEQEAGSYTGLIDYRVSNV